MLLDFALFVEEHAGWVAGAGAAGLILIGVALLGARRARGGDSC